MSYMDNPSDALILRKEDKRPWEGFSFVKKFGKDLWEDIAKNHTEQEDMDRLQFVPAGLWISHIYEQTQIICS